MPPFPADSGDESCGVCAGAAVTEVAEIPVRGARCEEEVCRYCLGRHPATGGMLSQAETDLIHAHRVRRRFRAHERICAAGRTPPFFIGNLIEGVVKLSFAAPGAVDALLFPGDFLGPFGDSGRPTCTAAALTDCELCCFHSAGLHRVFARHPRLQENFLQHFAEAVERAREDAAKLRRPQAAARVAALLNIFAARAQTAAAADQSLAGAPGDAGIEVQLPLRRAEMGLLLGLSPETVSRALSRLRDRGIIRPISRRAWLIKDPPQLK
ncbi:MAG: Crp/Fnr family transcriptional regulator, partial [Gammaproteobacteria bacterium]|nr:Crp/Fnr family transcriptional regulator [Gammaproteobacteria bacterium]